MTMSRERRKQDSFVNDCAHFEDSSLWVGWDPAQKCSRDKQPSFFSSTTNNLLAGCCVGFVLSGKCTM
ncbi:unnamed protein product [Sphagnum jensenii]|uniref:Uncharacterized protein n=1 Tax=Sphagnum jensenii TaxID=128206 RepID=A0ABP1C0N4_9BRYO